MGLEEIFRAKNDEQTILDALKQLGFKSNQLGKPGAVKKSVEASFLYVKTRENKMLSRYHVLNQGGLNCVTVGRYMVYVQTQNSGIITKREGPLNNPNIFVIPEEFFFERPQKQTFAWLQAIQLNLEGYDQRGKPFSKYFGFKKRRELEELYSNTQGVIIKDGHRSGRYSFKFGEKALKTLTVLNY